MALAVDFFTSIEHYVIAVGFLLTGIQVGIWIQKRAARGTNFWIKRAERYWTLLARYAARDGISPDVLEAMDIATMTTEEKEVEKNGRLH